MKRAWLTVPAALAVYLGFKLMVVLRLRHFTIDEFRGWWPWLSVGLLEKIDDFRDQLGRPVMISPAPGAIVRIRPEEPKGDSDHYYGRALDIMLPQGPDLQTAAAVAREVGFNAIGVYPKWQPHQGLHLGLRPGLDHVATWGALKDSQGQQYYTSLAEALRYA